MVSINFQCGPGPLRIPTFSVCTRRGFRRRTVALGRQSWPWRGSAVGDSDLITTAAQRLFPLLPRNLPAIHRVSLAKGGKYLSPFHDDPRAGQIQIFGGPMPESSGHRSGGRTAALTRFSTGPDVLSNTIYISFAGAFVNGLFPPRVAPIQRFRGDLKHGLKVRLARVLVLPALKAHAYT